jgi:hypothetical protein
MVFNPKAFKDSLTCIKSLIVTWLSFFILSLDVIDASIRYAMPFDWQDDVGILIKILIAISALLNIEGAQSILFHRLGKGDVWTRRNQHGPNREDAMSLVQVRPHQVDGVLDYLLANMGITDGKKH